MTDPSMPPELAGLSEAEEFFEALEIPYQPRVLAAHRLHVMKGFGLAAGAWLDANPEADAAAFMADLGLHESGLDRVIRASYDLLGYISFFTVGEDECRAWSIPRDTPAVLAAGEIHTDISRGFIRAEVVRYEDLVARGSLAACREHGELRLEGKEYIVLDGDVINFRHAT